MKKKGYEHRAYHASGAAPTNRAQYRSAHGSSDRAQHRGAHSPSERARHGAEKEMRALLKKAFCGVDTCSLLGLHREDIEQSERRQEYFLSMLERLCRAEKEKIFTTVLVWEELHSLEKRGDAVMKRFTRRAIEFVRRMNAAGLLVVGDRRSSGQVNADQELFLIATEEYRRNPVCIFTQDKALAEALLRQNENEMVYHYEIMVRRINMGGYPTEFDFERDEPERESGRQQESRRYGQDGSERAQELSLSGLCESFTDRLRRLCDRIFFGS